MIFGEPENNFRAAVESRVDAYVGREKIKPRMWVAASPEDRLKQDKQKYQQEEERRERARFRELIVARRGLVLEAGEKLAHQHFRALNSLAIETLFNQLVKEKELIYFAKDKEKEILARPLTLNLIYRPEGFNFEPVMIFQPHPVSRESIQVWGKGILDAGFNSLAGESLPSKMELKQFFEEISQYKTTRFLARSYCVLRSDYNPRSAKYNYLAVIFSPAEEFIDVVGGRGCIKDHFQMVVGCHDFRSSLRLNSAELTRLLGGDRYSTWDDLKIRLADEVAKGAELVFAQKKKFLLLYEKPLAVPKEKKIEEWPAEILALAE